MDRRSFIKLSGMSILVSTIPVSICTELTRDPISLEKLLDRVKDSKPITLSILSAAPVDTGEKNSIQVLGRFDVSLCKRVSFFSFSPLGNKQVSEELTNYLNSTVFLRETYGETWETYLI